VAFVDYLGGSESSIWIYMSNGPCRVGPMLCRRLSRRYGPSCLTGRASTGFVCGIWPKARPAGWFPCYVGSSNMSCRASPRPIKPKTTHFHQYFHQLFIIFTNIIINNTYIQSHSYTNSSFSLGQPLDGPCPCRATCLGGGPGMAWSLRLGQPGPGGHRIVSCSGRAKSLGYGSGHRAIGCMAMYTCGLRWVWRVLWLDFLKSWRAVWL